jgi:alkylhydroperoxidase family enzyme
MPRIAWIETISEDKAEGQLADLYNASRSRVHKTVDNILKVHSLRPQSLADHLQLYVNTMHGSSGLSPAEREMMAVVVSAINVCHY